MIRIDIEKFICSLINRASGFSVIKVIDIIDALNNQGLDYKDGKIVRITPELKESEDERILNCIRICLTDCDEQRFEDFNTSLKDCLAWLEKQGEQSIGKIENPSVRKYMELDKFALANMLVERDKNNAEITQAFKEISASAPMECEQILALSDEDIATISRIISIVKWAAYSDHSHPILNDEGATELVERLKSFKDRYTWKPNDEQMDAIRYVSNFDYGGHKATLVSLYEQLKKLKE